MYFRTYILASFDPSGGAQMGFDGDDSIVTEHAHSTGNRHQQWGLLVLVS